MNKLHKISIDEYNVVEVSKDEMFNVKDGDLNPLWLWEFMQEWFQTPERQVFIAGYNAGHKAGVEESTLAL